MKNSGRIITALSLSLILCANTMTPAFAAGSVVKREKPVFDVKKVERPELRGVQHMSELNPSKRTKSATGIPSLLDEVGRLRKPVTEFQVRDWRSELMSPTAAKSRKYQIRIWLAELTMRAKENPQEALAIMERLMTDMPTKHALRGLAKQNLGIVEMANGMYDRARRTFNELLTSRLTGFDRRVAMLWNKHAIACAGYHDLRREAGITEPTHIDPLCGASSLAIALKHLGLPHEKGDVAAKTPHTGFGSDMQDLEKAASTFGLVGKTILIKNESLRDFFKLNGGIPVIAHVERDHFVAVSSADEKGVTYWCSDCGHWPGGPQQVTWKQWELMEAGAYMAVATPNSDFARSLELLASSDRIPDIETVWAKQLMASLNPAPSVYSERLVQIATSLATLGVAQHLSPWWWDCGQMPWSHHCNGCNMTPTFAAPGAQVTLDPVNLANGAEEYTAPGGLNIYNPKGPSVHWTHHYNSLAQTVPNGWGMGWYHSYLTTIWLQEVPPLAGETGGFIQLPNSARIDYTFGQSGAPTSGNTWTATFSESGHMYQLKWTNASGTQSMELMDPSRTKYLFEKKMTPFTGASRWFLVKVEDKTGHYITLQWSSMLFNEVDAVADTYNGFGLITIKDEAGSNLLELDYDDGRLLTATDRYDRRIYYAHDEFESVGSPTYWHDELTAASVIYDTNESLPPGGPVARFLYTYDDHNSGGSMNPSGEKVAFLKTISAIKPSGSGYSTAEIFYDNYWYVEAIEDGNGVTSTFEIVQSGSPAVDQPEVKVKVMDSTTVIYQYQVRFDMDMNWTRIKDASGDTVVELTFGGAGTTFRPHKIKDGNNREWDLTWNGNSQLLSVETPKGTTKTLTRSTTNNPFGEVTVVTINGKTSTQIDYFSNGLVDEVRTPIPGQANTGNRQTTNFTYNTYGDVETIVSPGNNAGSTKTVSIDYGMTPKKGQPLIVTDPNGNDTTYAYTPRGQLETVTDDLGNSSEATYNLADQVVLSYLPETGNTGTERSFSENVYPFPGGFLLGVNAYDENEDLVRAVAYTYGNEGELLTRTGSTEPVTLTYTNLYQTETVEDGNNNTTTYTYNTDGLLTEIDYPGATSTNFDQIKFTTYDVVGNLMSRTDGRGIVTDYEYNDADGFLSKIDYAGGSTDDVTIDYDDYGRVIEVNDSTGVSTVEDYDDLDNVLESTRTYTSLSTKTFTYSYFADGSRDTLTTPAGDWEYLYDIGGRCTSMISPAGTHTIDYLTNDWLEKRTLPNGTYTNYTYNEIGMPDSVVSKTSAHSTLTSFGTFSYDGVFNMLEMSATYTGLTSFSGDTDWTYDTKNRLTQETSTRYAGWTDNNTFDAAFNPTTFKGNSRSYNSNNQLTTGSMTYDGNGNPTTYGGTSFTYDVENRITAVGTALTCGYRADGLRAWKQALRVGSGISSTMGRLQSLSWIRQAMLRI